MRTHGFPSPSLGGFGFVKIDYSTMTVAQTRQLSIGRNHNAIPLPVYRAALLSISGDVRFGSLAVITINISLATALGCKADIERVIGGNKKPGTWPGFPFLGSGASLCTLARAPDPVAVLEVPLIAA